VDDRRFVLALRVGARRAAPRPSEQIVSPARQENRPWLRDVLALGPEDPQTRKAPDP